MEVKSIFMNLIMRTYEKQNAMNTTKLDKASGEGIADSVTISPRASKRLFRDIMEHTLQKGLSEVLIDEN
jgi:transcriptional regulator GlxA family with amidase domain